MAKTYLFHVKGTTCTSCEVVIEREVRELDGVLGVDVSHAKGVVAITMKKGHPIHAAQLESLLGTHGYQFSKKEKELPPQPWNWGRIATIVGIVALTYFILSKAGFLTYSPTIDGGKGLAGVFLIGLIASVSSCTAVLGGLLVAVSASSAKQNQNKSLRERMRPHILFNAGRLIGFLFFGAIIGLVGSLIQLSIGFNGLLILIVALLMIGLGVNLLGIVPRGVSVIRPPQWLTHKIHDLSTSHHPHVPFALGALTFFLPCGFTQAMQLYALSLGDMKSSALLMGVFALGTLPALLGIGAITSSATGERLKKITAVAGVLVITLGISNVQNSFALLDWHPFAFTGQSYTVDASAPTMVGGEQLIQMEVSERGLYIPDELTVVEGIPVRWEIFGADFMGCADSLIMREFGINTHLDPGSNTVTFTPTQTGRFTYSCSMGMIRGTMYVIPQETL